MTDYYLPAEWQTQKAVQLTWPHDKTDWHNNNILAQIEEYFVHLATSILEYQDVIITAYDQKHKKHITGLLNKSYKHHYHIYIAESNDTWARDHGPITLISNKGQNKTLDFNFNAWGGKFDYHLDNLITATLYAQQAYSDNHYEKINYILEGGSIDSNGTGTVLTTASCILNKNRNADLSEDEIISNLKKYLNISNLIILKNSFLHGDDTDGHIDMMARFCTPEHIVYTACDNPDNPNYESLKKLEQELSSLEIVVSKKVKLIPMYIPNPIYDEDQLLPASYVNFLIINNAVIVPTYNDKHYDRLALESFKKLLPERSVIGIDSNIAISQGGSLHCLTMQIPA